MLIVRKYFFFLYFQVVTVWQYESRRKMLSVKQSLYGHTDAVTCLASSSAYNVIISGSRDATAIVWDLCRGIFVRQLIGHVGPVAAVTVNNLTVNIFFWKIILRSKHHTQTV